MKIKDIVNRDLVNLTNCDQEPIHIPGSIQPHGFLVGIKPTGIIDFCSGNVADITGVSYQQLLDKTPDVFISGPDVFAMLRTAADNPQSPVSVLIGDTSYSCFAHKSGDHIIAEFEPVAIQPLELSELYNLNLESINSLQSSDTLQRLAQRISAQIKKLTGYDRVMIYRFDEQYNGEVFAESREEYLEPFLGLHYPHTDIPAQARALYIKNLLRVIVDVNYTPAPLYTIDDADGKNLDLGMAALRSVSPIHIEYLQNIGVRATLTISLLHEGKLWGLVACHHYSSSKFLSAYTRVSAQLMAKLLTSQIQVREVAEEYEMAKQVNASLEKLLIEPNELNIGSFEKMVQRPELLSLCNAGGAAIVLGENIFSAGNTPGTEIIHQLARQLAGKSKTGMFTTTCLKDIFESEEAVCAVAAGIMYYHLEGNPLDCIIWFRPETNEEVKWAGDPDKAIIKNEKGLSPRNSFELWRQIIKCRSSAWAKPEIAAATTFVHALQKHVHMFVLSEEELKYRQLSVRLKQANEELENINWISTHDLKEPLRKIQIFSSRVLSKEQADLSELMVDSLQKMNASANRMQQLITDITAYSKLRHTEDVQLDVNLYELVTKVTLEIKEENPEASFNIAGSLPVIKGIPLLLSQLFINLLRNAIKFRSKDADPVISIDYLASQTCSQEIAGDKLFHKVTVKDNGIGFSEKHREDIFKVFTKLHNAREYAGSGIGLALCRQIMQIHNGYITADGMVGEGAEFALFFPES